ncbi:MAG: spore cortex biosynthesis protein YabQ [Clostridia bacterium]|nr:spore cortex biosynthesis protein YabQ [Clostridia bacterium]
MNLYQFNQTQFLFLSFALGFAAGIVFEFFRILRRAFPHGVLAVALEDLAFFIITSAAYWILCFAAALGRLRWFSFFALVLGFFVYLLSLGRLLTALSGAIIAFMRRLIGSVVNFAAVRLRAVFGFFVRPVCRAFSALGRRAVRIKRRRQLKKFLRWSSRGFR